MINPLNFFRKKDEQGNEIEDVNEKRTSTLGYVLLIFMVIFVISVGQTIFHDLESIPEKPSRISQCVSIFSGKSYDKTLNTISYTPTSCVFGDIDYRFGLEADYKLIENDLKRIVAINKQINTLSGNINKTQRDLDRTSNNYDVSLQEKMAQEQNPVMDRNDLQQNIINQRTTVLSTQAQIKSLENERNVLVKKIDPTVQRIKTNLVGAERYYERAVAIYNLKTFFLKLLFISPLFAFSVYYYLKLKKKNSPYTIIYTAIVGATSFLFLEIILVLLYDIIPKEFIERIFEFFRSIVALRFVLYYGSVILVIAIFGGIVYYIQKRVYNPQNVAMRRLKDNKCPGCSFLINLHYNHCPKCGRQLKNECEHCGNLRMSDLPHCPNCGN